MRRRYRDTEEKLTPEGRVLDQFLFQYKDCLREKKQLERRRGVIMLEFEQPLSAINYDGMPKGSGISAGSAAISLRLAEIDDKIGSQIQKSLDYLSMVMDVINLLKDSSLERSVLESRYIDGLNWEKLCRDNFVSRSKAIRYWKKGLYKLLEHETVLRIAEEYEK